MSRRIRRPAVIAGAVTLLLIAASVALAFFGSRAAASPRTGEKPAENVTFSIRSGSHLIWFDAIGQGSATESPVVDQVRQLVADGFTLRVSGCGTKANPCVISWPASPPEGKR